MALGVFSKVQGIVRTATEKDYQVMFRSKGEAELDGFLMNVRIDEAEGLDYLNTEVAQKIRREITLNQSYESQQQ